MEGANGFDAEGRTEEMVYTLKRRRYLESGIALLARNIETAHFSLRGERKRPVDFIHLYTLLSLRLEAIGSADVM